MRVAVTGTPGTGKTGATERITGDYDVIHLNEAIRTHSLFTERDERRDSVIADLDAVREWLGDRDDVVVDSHLSHLLAVDRVIVLRCRPDILETRLLDRGEPESKAHENRESEALDLILAEAVDRHGLDAVYEIDTTDRSPADVATAIEAVLAGDREPSAGTVDFLEYA